MTSRHASRRRFTVRLLAGFLLAGSAVATRGAGAPQDAGPESAATVQSVEEIRLVPVDGGASAPAILGEAEIRRRLRREIGRPCEPERIAESLAAPYRFLGYVPLVRVACHGEAIAVHIRESSHRIGLITFDASELSRLRLTAGDRLPDEPQLYPVPESAPRNVILGLLRARVGDLYNTQRYRSDRETLERLGYLLIFIPGPPADGDGYPEAAYLIQSLRPVAEGPKARARRLNYFGGTGSYGPRSGPAAGLVYQRNDLVRSFDRLSVSPTYNNSVGGEINYAAPFIAARATPRRLYDFDMSLFSTFQNDRLLEGDERDERRSGISLGLGLRSLGLSARHDLRLQFGVRREAVRIETGAPGEAGADLTLLRLSATHEWRHTTLSPSLSVRTLPTLDLSLGRSDGVPYVRPGLGWFLHGRAMSGVEVDLHVAAGALDRPVPDFELWSLGGATTVRGFEPDALLGRGLLALQAEIWLPFVRPLEARPVASGLATDAPVEPSLARRIKWALFVDGGSIWQSTAGDRSTLFGAGAGVRFVVPHQPLVIRVDYGWGLGQEGGDAFPYVSIGYVF